uniref:Type-1 angiotensin II receptor A n=1 Tax=Phallusia mammillata TaxID=59560 RepID=A0A6F9DUG5_9ASCI|nr:type-1 angiotensin II receptor A [Phallusia mammillata]
MSALTAIAAILFIVFFIGIIGNAVVLFVLLRQRSSWTVTTTYLFNLALADSLFICFVPFWGHYYLSAYAWSFGLGMCKLTSVITSVNMYGSVFFLTAMSVDRWMAVVHATSVNAFRTSTVARWVCFIIWSAALLLSLPRIIYQTLLPFSLSGGDSALDSTSDNSNESLATTEATQTVVACQLYIPSNYTNKSVIMGSLEFIQSMVGFVIPMTVICICYVKIVLTVKKKVISKRVRKDRVAKLAALIIAAFFFCWLPFHVMKLISATLGWWAEDVYFNEALFIAINPFTICLAYANSCINPIVYAFTTTNFQENIKDMCGSDETRPYKMTVGHPAHDEKKNLSPRKGGSPCLNANPDPRAKVWANKVQKQTQNVQVHPPPCEEQNALRAPDGETAEDVSFSYYSCPAVMQGLGKANEECMAEVDSAAPYSTPDANAYNTCDTCEA